MLTHYSPLYESQPHHGPLACDFSWYIMLVSQLMLLSLWDCSIQHRLVFHHTECTRHIWLWKIHWSLRGSACYFITSFLSQSGEAARVGLVLVGHRSQPTLCLTLQIREKLLTFVASEHETCSLSLALSGPFRHKSRTSQACTHPCTFFIIIPELIGSNYLPWLWLVSLKQAN